MGHGVRQITRGAIGGHAEAGDARHVLSPGAQAAFLTGAMQDAHGGDAFLEHQSAHALRSAQLVRRQGQAVRVQRPHIDRNLARRLDGVDVQPAALRAHQSRRLGDGLDHATFIVRMVDGDHGPARPLQRLSQPDQIDHAIAIYRQDLDRRARRRRRLGHARMLGRADDQALATGGKRADDGLSIGFCAARGKDHGGRVRPDQLGHLGSRRLDPRPRAATGGMNRRRIAVVSQSLGHDFLSFRPHQTRGVVIQIDAHAAASMPATAGAAPMRA
ncbi:hypothetical protein D3C71_348570 [compost metagenome]